MTSYTMEVVATDENFDEAAYLRANADVVAAIKEGHIASARSHFEAFGRSEGRKMRFSPTIIADAKHRKLRRIKPLLRREMLIIETPTYYDFLSEQLRTQCNIVDTSAVSSHGYDAFATALVGEYQGGLVLDCGAGKRPVYFDNVVNLDIVDYDTTDVRGVGEVLPFVDGSFDAVISIAVLEHVRDPFACAREIARVLKPGGKLMCCVPFLQPLHGYPHHYYNMSSQGLENLFSDLLKIEKVAVYQSVLPIWSLTWILRSWAAGLQGKTRSDFLEMKIGELTADATKYLKLPFVTELSEEKNFELASATVLFAQK